MSADRLRIGIVDDEDGVRKSVQRLLRSAGMEVRTFGSGRAFLDAARESKLDFVVLDLHMPAMSGFEVQQHLVLAGIRLPVAIITGQDTDEDRARALASGAVAYLPKPIDERELFNAIASVVPVPRRPATP
jgi:FixJ family two-component response regulator